MDPRYRDMSAVPPQKAATASSVMFKQEALQGPLDFTAPVFLTLEMRYGYNGAVLAQDTHYFQIPSAQS